MIGIILFVVLSLSPSELDVNELRVLFFQSEESKKSCQSLLEMTKMVDETSNAIEIGYKGMGEMMMANHRPSPFKKMKHFKHGKKWLNMAIDKDNHSIELRFLRMSVQENLPFFLGYRKNIDEDRAYVLRQLDTLEEGFLKEKIVDYLNHSK